MKRVFFLIHAFLLLRVLAAGDVKEEVVKKLHWLDDKARSEFGVYAREIQALPAPERTRVLDTFELLVSETPSSGITGKVIAIWIELRDETRILRSLVPRIEQTGMASGEDFAAALAICQAPEAAEALAGMVRSLMNRVAASATAVKDRDSERQLGDDAGFFLRMFHTMAASTSPHTRRALERIETEFVARAQSIKRMRDMIPYLSKPPPGVELPVLRATRPINVPNTDTQTNKTTVHDNDLAELGLRHDTRLIWASLAAVGCILAALVWKWWRG